MGGDSAGFGRCYWQEVSAGPLRQDAWPAPVVENDQRAVRVVACAPSPWDRTLLPTCYPRIPGNVFVCCPEATETSAMWQVSGTVCPCNECSACRSGRALGCLRPRRPGVNSPGGSAIWTVVSPAQICPVVPRDVDPAELAGLLAMAGMTYQAACEVGMGAGDSAVVFGDLGPGALPLQLLVALGLQVYWVTGGADDARCPALPSEVRVCEGGLPALGQDAGRIQLIDLGPGPGSGQFPWLSLLGSAASLTLVGPQHVSLAIDFPRQILVGPVAVRRVQDLHPHLILDLVALWQRGLLTVEPWIERVSWSAWPAHFLAWQTQRLSAPHRWPVLVAADGSPCPV